MMEYSGTVLHESFEYCINIRRGSFFFLGFLSFYGDELLLNYEKKISLIKCISWCCSAAFIDVYYKLNDGYIIAKERCR